MTQVFNSAGTKIGSEQTYLLDWSDYNFPEALPQDINMNSPAKVAQAGIAKMKAAVQAALG